MGYSGEFGNAVLAVQASVSLLSNVGAMSKDHRATILHVYNSTHVHSFKAISISKHRPTLPYSAWHLVAQSDIWFLFYFHLGRLWEVSIYLLEYHLCWRNTQFQSTHSRTWNFIIIANNSFEISIEKGSLAQVTMGLAGSGQNPGSPDFWPQDMIPSLPYPC